MSSEGPFRDRDGTGFDLIETMRWEPDGGFVRLERHMARLATSAGELGFAFSQARVEQVLNAAVAAASATPLRVRLTVSSEGQPACVAPPLSSLPPDTVWKLRIAKTRLSSADPLLRHKTTRRRAYEAARAEFTQAEADEVLLLNERGELCEGTITSLFVDTGHGGPLKTPSLACGLLAGVLRGEMLDAGIARETVLFPGDLTTARAILVGNSLRGLIRAKLAE